MSDKTEQCRGCGHPTRVPVDTCGACTMPGGAPPSVLEEAAKAIEERGGTYGDSLNAIARLWSGWLYTRYMNGLAGDAISGHDVAQLFVLAKVGRTQTGARLKDNYVDQAGYSALAYKLATRPLI